MVVAVVWASLAPHARLAAAAPNPPVSPTPPPLAWPLVPPIVESEEVGYLPGSGAVTATGDYEYTLPIDVPEGRAGMAPEVALRYSSRGGAASNGLLGVGWSLDHGGSEITRCAKTFLHDGHSDSPSYSPGDALCLDGQRLVQINQAPPMGEGAEYRTARDSFARIVAHAPSAEAAGWFEVHLKSGRVRVYSPLSAKRIPPTVAADVQGEPASLPPPVDVPFAWLLTEERDRAGNALWYQYDIEPDSAPPHALEYRIASIAYTARVAGDGTLVEAPRRKIVFEYSAPGDRPDPIVRYEGGIRRSVSRRLLRIVLVAPNPALEEPIGHYALTYETGKNGEERSFLTAVHRYDASAARRMWARTFEWSHRDLPQFSVVDPPQLAGAFHDAQPFLFDADNDGRDDLLVNGHFCWTTPSSVVPWDACVSGAATAGIWGRPVDVNGDGKVDVLKSTPSGAAYATWNSATSTFDPMGHAVAPTSQLIDADGDGLVDAFVVGPRLNPAVTHYDQEWYLRLNTGTAFADPVAPAVAAPYLATRKAVALDLDGNGRGELHTMFHPADEPPGDCTAIPSQPWEYSAIGLSGGGTVMSRVVVPRGPGCNVLLDLNGDGLRDRYFAEDKQVVRYNTGTGFLPPEPFAPLVHIYPRLGHYQSLEAADIDGDGREDLISTRETGVENGSQPLPGSRLYLTRNNGFEVVDLSAAPYEIPAYDPEPLVPALQDHSPVLKVGDVNGDGLADLVAVLRDRSDNTSRVRLLLQVWKPYDRVVRVGDEPFAEPRESIFYSAFPGDTPSPSTCEHPARCIRHGAVVAREHWVHRHDVPSAVRRTAYEFDDLRADQRGRGVLGFARVRVVDLDSFAETITSLDPITSDGGLYPFAGLPRDEWNITPILPTSTDPSGGVLLPSVGPLTARVVHTHHEHERRFTNGGLTHAVFETSTRTEEWEQHVAFGNGGFELLGDGSATSPRVRHQARQQDDLGNELFSATWTEGGDRCETTTVPQNDLGNWQIGLPLSVAVTCHKDGQPLPEPRLRTFEHDSRGLLAQVTAEPDHPELTQVTTYTRNNAGLVTRITQSAPGESPRETFLAYDDEGVYPRAVWNALGHYQQQLVHPALGVPVVAQDPNGIQAHYRYDGFGRVREIDPDDAAATLVSYAQDAALPWALVVTETHEDGGGSRVLVDEHGRTFASAHVGFDGQWVHERVTDNRFGQRTEVYRPSIGQPPTLKTVTTFDTLGRTLSIEEPNGATTSQAHSMFETVTTDPEGRQHKIVRDKDDRVLQSADLHNGQWVGVTFHYGAFGQLEHTVDPAGSTVHVLYDKLGRRRSLDDPDRGLTQWTYTAFGEVATETDALGDTTVFERDSLGRVISTAHDTYGITTFVYDGAGDPGERGRLTATSSPDGVQTTHEYDDLGRNTRTSWTVGTDTYDVVRAYDGFSRLDTLRYPLVPGRAPFVVRYGYNAHGYGARVDDATDPKAPKAFWIVGSRNAEGELVDTTAGNGVDETRQYDPATGRLLHIEAVHAGTALVAMQYSRDLTGNLLARTDESLAAPRKESFAYDDLDRLTTWHVESGDPPHDTTYAYDLLGNLEVLTRNGAVETHAHAGQLQNGVLALPHALTGRTVAGQTASYFYDARGRQVTGGGRELTWTPFDLPATHSQWGQLTTFAYDAFQARVRKVRTAGGAPVEVVDTIAELYERRSETGSPVSHVFVVHGTDGPVAQVVYTEAAAAPEATLYMHREAQGSVGLVTDSQGGEVARTYFDPFGEKVAANGAVVSPLLGPVKLGFTGHRHDDELGLVHMRGRVFDPSQKRFLTPDPHVPDPLSLQSYHRFSYVMNNPLRYTDPSGFLPAAGDLKTKGGAPESAPPAAPEVPATWPRTLTAAEIVVTAKADDTAEPPASRPAGKAAKEEAERKWGDFFKKMAWGAAKQLFSSAPPVVVARQIRHNVGLLGTAVGQAWNGDWRAAGSTVLEMPQQAAEGAARVVTGPIEAALAVPATVRAAMESDADPEKRGAAAVQAVQNIATVVLAAVAASRAVKPAAPGKVHGNSLDSPSPARGYSLRDAKTGEVLKYGETTLGTKRYSKAFLEGMNARMKFEAVGTKRQMHQWQHQKILEYKAQNGGQRPPLNKSDY
ncbi:MAG: FG-GAP-like repeat-containing protein [Polyangiaceae bacterium]